MFGDAVTKLAASTMFPLAVGIACGLFSVPVGCVVVFVFTLALLKTFFDLEVFELIAIMVAQVVILTFVGSLHRISQSKIARLPLSVSASTPLHRCGSQHGHREYLPLAATLSADCR